MNHLSASSANAASTTTELYLTLGFLVVFALYIIIVDYRLDHRWKVYRGIRNAPSVDIQEIQIREFFDGSPRAIIDPRKFTVTVARMNGIANTYGYYYVGERGHLYGSTQVAFQRLPCPPPPRIPTGWKLWEPLPVIYTPPPEEAHRFPTGIQPSGYPYMFPAQNGTYATYTPQGPYIPTGIGRLFNGRDIVEVIGPFENPAQLADIAYRCGYVFAWSYMPRSRSRKARPWFCFRRLRPAE